MKTSRFLSVLVFVCASSATWALTPSSSLWDDRPLKIIQTTEANFPAVMAMQGMREGEARAVLHVDPEGKLVDCLVTAYTHPALANEILTHVRAWEYEPARHRGEAIGTRVEVSFRFEARRMVLSLTAGDSMNASLKGLIADPVISLVAKPAELDTPPALVHVVQPAHPGRAARTLQGRGSVAVDFYIDAEGRPRMPVVTRASDQTYAAAALDAVSQWRFAPPRRDGRAVLVRVVQQIVFPELPKPAGPPQGAAE